MRGMGLTKDELEALEYAIKGYDFPCVYYDFLNGHPVQHTNMLPVEKFIRSDLISRNPELVKNGLSNVLYWGFAEVGYRDRRVKDFRDNVTQEQLNNAGVLFDEINEDCLTEIKKIVLPQFGFMSFITKVRMFLDPINYVVLDRQILKMRKEPYRTLLDDIRLGHKETAIRISRSNIDVYIRWCKKCGEISLSYFNNKYRAVDIERGFFYLIQNHRGNLAARILSKA
jgi:hypothetical protein